MKRAILNFLENPIAVLESDNSAALLSCGRYFQIFDLDFLTAMVIPETSQNV